MEELRKLLVECLNIDFLNATISNPKSKDGITKIKVRPLLKKDNLIFQCELFKNNQALPQDPTPRQGEPSRLCRRKSR